MTIGKDAFLVLVSFLLGWYTSAYFSDVPKIISNATIENGTFLLEIKNEALFKSTGEIRLFDETNKEVYRYGGLSKDQSTNISIPLNIAYVNVTLNKTNDFQFSIPFLVAWKLNKIVYQIGCENCVPKIVFGWTYDIQLRSISGNIICKGTEIGLPNCTLAEIPIYSFKTTR